MNKSDTRLVATVISAPTEQDKLENRVRYILDQLAQRVNLPYGMVLEGRVTQDRFNNRSLYVFLRTGWDTFPGEAVSGNSLPRIDEVEGGKWISLNKTDINFDWEARDIKKALENFKATR